jgi:uncharacterized protein
MKSLLLVAILFVLAAPVAGAQTTPVRSHVEAAESLLDLLDMDRMLRQSTDAMLRMQQEQNPMLAQFDDIMREFLERYLSWEELRPEYVRLYTDIYSEAELREMQAFYRTPLGQRMIATMPELMIRSSEISQRRMQAHMPELMRRLMERASGASSPGTR